MAILTRNIEERYQQNPVWLAWLVCLSASLLVAYEFFNQTVFGSLSVPLMKAFHLNAGQLGVLSSTYFYANALFLIPAGLLLDRYSTRAWILVAMLFCTVGTFGFALAPNAETAGVFRFIVGLGGAFCLLSCVRLTSRWFKPRQVALVIGVIVTIGMFGYWMAQGPMSMLAQWLGWRDAMILDGFVGIALTGWIALIVQSRPSGQAEIIKSESQTLRALGVWRSVKKVLSKKQNWLCGGYAALMNLPIYILGALWGSIFLQQVYHYPKTTASFISGMIFIGSIIGCPLAGWLSDRIGNRRMPMFVGAIVALGVMLTIIFDVNLSYVALCTCFFLLGLFTSTQVVSYPTVSESNAPVFTGTAISVISTTIVFSGAIMQPVSGWILNAFWKGKFCGGVHCYSLGDYQNAMIILPISFVIAIVLVFFVRETRCRRLETTDDVNPENQAHQFNNAE